MVTPFVGVWIEIVKCLLSTNITLVTPFVGVWIEIACTSRVGTLKTSLPSWECGLKYSHSIRVSYCCSVTPFVGVWIEICPVRWNRVLTSVTPFVGVWIEIDNLAKEDTNDPSLPSWECGLKFQMSYHH